jgi:meiotically up-regulated gene 157 (Mug157) protein
MFRPSDDATIYPFLIPSNLFAISSLQQLAQMTQKIHSDSSFAQKCSELADDIEEAIKKYAIIEHLNYGKIYAYEIDGFGNRIFIDDANIPSLLSLPYLDICNENDPIYRNTRSFILSNNNPYYFKGKHAQGIGSPHVAIDMIWPMSIIMQGLTSSNNQEIISCLQMLKDTHACTGFMHESFHKNNPSNYTRDWFAWANSLFGELIYRIYVHNPDLLQQI